MKLSEKLKKLRTERSMSQTYMAKKLNISRQAYNHYETGRRTPPVEMLIDITNIFDVDLNTLVDKTDNPISPEKKEKSRSDVDLEQAEDEKRLREITKNYTKEDWENLIKFADYLIYQKRDE